MYVCIMYHVCLYASCIMYVCNQIDVLYSYIYVYIYIYIYIMLKRTYVSLPCKTRFFAWILTENRLDSPYGVANYGMWNATSFHGYGNN